MTQLSFVTMIVNNFRCVLTWFEAVLGLRVHLAKSSILDMGQVENIQLLTVF